MRLLTKPEQELLSRFDNDSGDYFITEASPEFALFAGLVEHGRCKRIESPDDVTWEITPAGRDALRLWPLLVDLGLVLP